MRKIIFTLLIIHCSFFIANAQWMQMSNGIGTDKNVQSLANYANYIYAGTYYNGLYVTTDYGINWFKPNPGNSSIDAVTVRDNNVVIGIYNNVISTSTDYGYSWTYSGLYAYMIEAFIYDSNKIIAGGTYGIFSSTNQGFNWIQIIEFNYYRSASCFAKNGNYIFAGVGSWDFPNGVFRSTDNGNSWQQTPFNNEHIWSLATKGDTVFAGTDAGMYKSTNNGLVWTQCGLQGLTLRSIAIFHNCIFTGTYNYGVCLSTNDGINWIPINQGFEEIYTINSMIIANNYVFAGTSNHSVWRRPLSDFVGIQNISYGVPSVYYLFQNFPNPFNPTTTIKFDIPKSSIVKISIYDITGKELEVLVNEKLQAGTYQTTWNASIFSSGVYFYRLQTENYSDTKKLILLK